MCQSKYTNSSKNLNVNYGTTEEEEEENKNDQFCIKLNFMMSHFSFVFSWILGIACPRLIVAHDYDDTGDYMNDDN